MIHMYLNVLIFSVWFGTWSAIKGFSLKLKIKGIFCNAKRMLSFPTLGRKHKAFTLKLLICVIKLAFFFCCRTRATIKVSKLKKLWLWLLALLKICTFFMKAWLADGNRMCTTDRSSCRVAGRTQADATLMGTWGEEEIRGDKRQWEGRSDWIREHIAHYSPLCVLAAGSGHCAAHSLCCGVRVCGRLSICFRTLAHFSTLPFVPGRNQWREQQDAAESK